MHAHSPVPWKNLPSSSERAVQPVCCIHFSFTLKTQSGGQAGAAPPPFFSPMAFTLAAAHNDAQMALALARTVFYFAWIPFIMCEPLAEGAHARDRYQGINSAEQKPTLMDVSESQPAMICSMRH